MKYLILLLLTLGLAQGESDNINNSSEENARIINGDDAVKGEFPFMARIKVKPFGIYDYYCGGVLISPTVVLTAGHCVADWLTGKGKGVEQPHVFSVVLGDLAVDADEEGQVEVKVHRVYQHPNYNDRTYQFDVAAFILSQSVQLVDGVIEAIDVYSGADKLAAGEMVTIIGWGGTEETDRPNHLQKLTYAVSDQELCVEWWADYDDRPMILIDPDTMFCASNRPNMPACYFGDSGGPVVWQSGSGLVLYGLVSWGDEDDEDFDEDAYDVHAYLPGMMEFINRAKDVEVENYINIKGGLANEGVVVFHKVGEMPYTACTEGMTDSETTATVICKHMGFDNGIISDPLLYKRKKKSNLMATVVPFGIFGLSCTADDVDAFQCDAVNDYADAEVPCFEQDLLAVKCNSATQGFEFRVTEIDDQTKEVEADGSYRGKVLANVEAQKNGFEINPNQINVALVNVEVVDGQLATVEILDEMKYKKKAGSFSIKVKRHYRLQKKCLVVAAFISLPKFHVIKGDGAEACGDIEALETQLGPAWTEENGEFIYNWIHGIEEEEEEDGDDGEGSPDDN